MYHLLMVRPLSRQVYEEMCGSHRLLSHRATLRTLRHPRTKEVLDKALVLYFCAPNSFTGEDVVEFQVHGSPAVVRDTLLAISDIDPEGVRPATPGEFTRRAFENGRMDLTSCEALDALLKAETSTQRRLALRTGGGRQAQLYQALRNGILEAMVHVEAMLDFSEEDGIDESLWESVCEQVANLKASIDREIPNGHPTSLDAVLRGTRLVLYGRPNAGKSMLLNKLVRRDAAIVSSEPGTTRDVVQATLELNGFRVLLSDTAGLRDSPNAIEQQGIARTQMHVQDADLSLLVCDAKEVDRILGGIPSPGFTRISRKNAEQLGLLHDAKEVFLFVNKMDTVVDFKEAPQSSDPQECRIWHGSALKDQGIDQLLADLGIELAERHSKDLSETPLVTEARHLHILRQVLQTLNKFLTEYGQSKDPDVSLAAEELRYAAYLVGQITGDSLIADEVLGQIFQRFCIGK
ncbi:mitochondrial splicing system protein [Malassezia psittaci]|uniref:Mitochondrial splicing system protein n=1 Tax=Malassezia psittaci TaxID=1821823 RepID=A0AAF0FFC3_9BASI|nr:mitochondrial splicing system protein [Malassezia psittaci]